LTFDAVFQRIASDCATVTLVRDNNELNLSEKPPGLIQEANKYYKIVVPACLVKKPDVFDDFRDIANRGEITRGR
jgi:hypothetical protein